MEVSWNRGTLKLSMLMGFSSVNHPFWGTPISGNPHICIYIYIYTYIHIQTYLSHHTVRSAQNSSMCQVRCSERSTTNPDGSRTNHTRWLTRNKWLKLSHKGWFVALGFLHESLCAVCWANSLRVQRNPGSTTRFCQWYSYNVRPPSYKLVYKPQLVIGVINQLSYLGGLTLYVWLFMACSTPDCVDIKSTFAISHTCHG